MFLRGYGSQEHVKNNGSRIGNTATDHASGQLGEVQGDATRNMEGRIEGRSMFFTHIPSSVYSNVWGGSSLFETYRGAYFGTSGWQGRNDVYYSLANDPSYEVGAGSSGVRMNAGKILPVANEVRPVNMAVKYIIKAK